MENNNKGISPMATGLAGMIIGAGVGAAVTRILTDKKTRDTVTDTLSGAKDKIISYAHRISRETKKTAKEGFNKAKE